MSPAGGHDPAVRNLAGAEAPPAPGGWYMACPCGWVAPLRRTEGSAAADLVAHLRAAAERAGAA